MTRSRYLSLSESCRAIFIQRQDKQKKYVRQAYYSSVRATPFAFRATQKEVCLYAERLPSFLMLRWKINARKFKHILGLEKYDYQT